MRALGENKSKVQIFTVGRHGLSAEVLEEILKHIEIQRLKKGGLCGEKFTSLRKSYQASVRWRSAASWSMYRRFVKVCT